MGSLKTRGLPSVFHGFSRTNKPTQSLNGDWNIYSNITIEHGPFMVDLPMKDGDFPVRYGLLPEDTNSTEHIHPTVAPF